MNITSLSPQSLRKAADLQERILELQNQLGELLGSEVAAEGAAEPSMAPINGRRKRRKLSAQGLANIRAGAAKRWGKRVAQPDGLAAQPKRKMSNAAKARLSALAKARWRKAKSAGKSRL
jgi:hypothetical protein